MDMDLKNKWVIGGGVVVGLILLMRSGGGSTQSNAASDNGQLLALQLQEQSVIGQASIAAQSASDVANINANALTEQGALNDISGLYMNDSNNSADIINNLVNGTTKTQLATIDANLQTNIVGMQTRTSVINTNTLANASVLMNGQSTAAAVAINNQSTQAAVQQANINASTIQNGQNNQLIGSLVGGAVNGGASILSSGSNSSSGGSSSSSSSTLTSLLPLLAMLFA